jgi:hypothetical protein
MTSKAEKVNWAAIEAEYRANQLSIRQIAANYNISEGGIRRRAKKEGWERDLADKVRKRVNDKLILAESAQASTREVRTNGTHDNVRTSDDGGSVEGPLSGGLSEDQIVEYAAITAVEVVRSHRADISRFKNITQGFAIHLERQVKSGKLKMVDAKSGKPFEVDIPLDYIARALNSGTGALKSLIGLERQAFNLDAGEDDGGDDEMENLMDLVMEERDRLMSEPAEQSESAEQSEQ